MKGTLLLVSYKDPEIFSIVRTSNHKRVAMWAIECVERVMFHFEERYPQDKRPQEALLTLKKWIITGKFSMKVIRHAALSSHAAAREIGEDSPAKSVARSAGQAVATAHVPTHAIAAANYVLQCIYRVTNSEASVEKERKWQIERLKVLCK